MFKLNRGRYLINTPTGYEYFRGVQKKIVDVLYTFTFSDNTDIKCSGGHAFLTNAGFKKAQDILLTDTLSGKIITNIEYVSGDYEVYDPVGVEKHETYLSNGVVSHNTEFLGSTNTLITGTKLQQLVYKEVVVEHDMMKIYDHPIKGDDDLKKDHLYCLMVDVSEGRNMDASAFSVFDISTTPYKQVATYKSSSISPILFPTVIYNAAKFYNDAYILVEINNNPQVADILHQDLEYDNLFKIFTGNKKPQQLSAGFGRGVQLGVKMSPAVKRIGCSNLKTLIEGNKLIIQDFDTIAELATFVANKTSFAAEEGANDDLVMTLVLFAWVATQKYFKEIVSHDIRKQIQLENMNQVDEETLPAPIIEDGLEHSFEVMDGDVWESADSGQTYSSFIRDMMRNL
jgi:hypothetical protein